MTITGAASKAKVTVFRPRMPDPTREISAMHPLCFRLRRQENDGEQAQVTPCTIKRDSAAHPPLLSLRQRRLEKDVKDEHLSIRLQLQEEDVKQEQTPPRTTNVQTENPDFGMLSDLTPTSTRKRRALDPPQHYLRYKKTESRQAASNFPSEFYDGLSEIRLTQRALQELDRRNEDFLAPRSKHKQAQSEKLAALTSFGSSYPDMSMSAACDRTVIDDFQPLTERIFLRMAPSSPFVAVANKRVATGGARNQWNKAATTSTQSKCSSAYDASFEQHCIDHHIYPEVYFYRGRSCVPRPANLEDIRECLKAPRRSPCPLLVSEPRFEASQDASAAPSDSTIMRDAVVLLASDADIPSRRLLPFNNLGPITEDASIFPMPDFFDGARPETVAAKVREVLDKRIIPNKKTGTPVAPNFFLETRSPGEDWKVAARKAVLDGAYGALGMHTLQNYLVDRPDYDGNAYVFSSTLDDKYLKLYAHHIAAPRAPRQPLDFHITLVKAYALSDDESFAEGKAAIRNLRIRAKEDRDRFIAAANDRVRIPTKNYLDWQLNVHWPHYS